ncbi:Protein of unknown function [Gryllus bimaculatus]|nr:Protein of unknown function [Gryllus bimaculatus]
MTGKAVGMCALAVHLPILSARERGLPQPQVLRRVRVCRCRRRTRIAWRAIELCLLYCSDRRRAQNNVRVG